GRPDAVRFQSAQYRLGHARVRRHVQGVPRRGHAAERHAKQAKPRQGPRRFHGKQFARVRLPERFAIRAGGRAQLRISRDTPGGEATGKPDREPGHDRNLAALRFQLLPRPTGLDALAERPLCRRARVLKWLGEWYSAQMSCRSLWKLKKKNPKIAA